MKNYIIELEQLRAKHKHKSDSKRRQSKNLVDFPDLTVKSAIPLSNTFTNGGFKKDVTTDHKWRKGSEEKAETIKAIEEKKGRIRMKFGKGAYEYATDGDNEGPLTIHRKGG